MGVISYPEPDVSLLLKDILNDSQFAKLVWKPEFHCGGAGREWKLFVK